MPGTGLTSPRNRARSRTQGSQCRLPGSRAPGSQARRGTTGTLSGDDRSLLARPGSEGDCVGPDGRRAVRRGDRRWRIDRDGSSPRCRFPRAVCGADRAERHRVRHFEPFLEAHPRRTSLPGAVRLQAGSRGTHRARPTPHQAGAPSRVPGAVHLSVPASCVGTRLRRRRRCRVRRPCRFSQQPAAETATTDASVDAGGLSRAGPHSFRRWIALLRRRHRRRPVRGCVGEDCGFGGSRHRHQHQGGGGTETGRSGHGYRRGRPGVWSRGDDPRRCRHQCDRGLDRRRRAARRRPGAGRDRIEGRPSRGTKGSHRIVDGAHHQDQEERAVHHPVRRVLVDRDHGHCMDPRPGAPGGVHRRHRLPARSGEPAPRRIVDPRRCRRGVRRVTTAGGRVTGGHRAAES